MEDSVKKFIAILLIPIVILSALSGCIGEKEETGTSNPPSKNLDSIPVLSTTGTISPKPDFFSGSTIDEYVYGGDEVTFDASGSYDPDGEIVSYEWLLDEENNKGTGPVVSHTYIFDEESVNFPNIVQIILTVEDNNGSIIPYLFNLGIIPKKYTFYLDSQSLKKQKPDSSNDKVKATFGRFRSTETLNYLLDKPVYLQKCKWNATIYIEKPILSFVNKVSLVLYDSNDEKIAEADSSLKLLDIWREKTITMSGSLNKPNELKSMELSVYGFSFGQKISILYGGEKASFICFDFTMQR